MTTQSDKDRVWKRNEVDSPCVQVCVIHPKERICMGCFRTIDEISGWSKMEPDERSAIKAELPSRAPRINTPIGRRATRPRARRRPQ